MSDQRMGRLRRGPHPVLLELLYEPQLEADRRVVLPYLLEIDAAHVVMLEGCSILPRQVAAELLTINRELAGRVERGEDFLGSPPSHRGLYTLYEGRYIEKLGAETGGAAHVARSRNDINAAVSRLRLRDRLAELLHHGCRLLEVATALADQHTTTVMSGFTHQQPAQPSSFGHYLAGVLFELTRSLEWAATSSDLADRSPLGAAAGLGTALPVDPRRIADLLGFAQVAESSLDAVASRDYLVHALGALTMLGNSMSRLATDLQTWSSAAYGFLGWRDDLVSTSSIMPQKRNAYVLENVRGEAMEPLGALVSTVAGMKNAPFANSVEVSGEAGKHVWPALDATVSALRLLALLVENVQVDTGRMRSFLDGRETSLTALADLLVTRYGIAFRTAHDSVGELVADGPVEAAPPPEVTRRLTEILLRRLERPVDLDEVAVERALDPEECLRSARYGGGPAPESVEAQLRLLEGRREALVTRENSWRRRRREAAVRLARAIDEVGGGGGETHEGSAAHG
jgi:argininosuccinate lyase